MYLYTTEEYNYRFFIYSIVSSISYYLANMITHRKQFIANFQPWQSREEEIFHVDKTGINERYN